MASPPTPADHATPPPSAQDPWKGAAEIDTALDAMAAQLRTLLTDCGIDRPLLVGIHTGGVWVAERLHARLGVGEPLGRLDISFYRDDFTQVGLHPQVRPSQLPVPVDDRHIVLIDDVLQSGRTIRAALNVLFDYGRPASVLLAILAERNGRELPIEPDVVGLHAALSPGEEIKLTGPEPLALVRGRTPRERRRACGGAPAAGRPDAVSPSGEPGSETDSEPGSESGSDQ